MLLYKNNRVTSFILIFYLSSCIYASSHVLLLSALATPSGSSSATTVQHDANVDVLASYKQARDIRTKQGHEAAVHHYQDLISRYDDVTAASRIAASPSSPLRHDLACPIDDIATKEMIPNLENVLQRSGYNHRNIQRLFGIRQLSDLEKNSDGEWGKAAALAFARGPVYVKPVSSRPQSQLPSLLDNLEQGSSLHCLVAMFLLGFAGE
jgi:hypothetical protein